MATNETQALEAHDVIKYEIPMDYCRESFIIEGAAMLAGYICEPGAAGKKKRVAIAGNADSICLKGGAVDDAVPFLVRGPAVVNADTIDYNSLAVATVDGALNALLIFKRSEI